MVPRRRTGGSAGGRVVHQSHMRASAADPASGAQARLAKSGRAIVRISARSLRALPRPGLGAAAQAPTASGSERGQPAGRAAPRFRAGPRPISISTRGLFRHGAPSRPAMFTPRTNIASALSVSRRRTLAFGAAWIAFALAIALHVADEAAHDFLALYNPAVEAILVRVPWLPLPTFTFATWITGLCLAVTLLLALAPQAFRGNRWLVRLAWPLGGLMVLNGLGHIGGSLVLGQPLAGVYSSPVLLAAAAWLLACAARQGRMRA